VLFRSRAIPSVPLTIPFESYPVLFRRIYLSDNRLTLRTNPTVRVLNLLRHSIGIAYGGSGLFNLIPITYAFLPRLRGRLTQGRRALPWKPWIFGEEDSHLLYRVLMPCIFTSIRSSAPYGTPSAPILRSPTACKINCKPVISALCLVPYIIGAKPLDW